LQTTISANENVIRLLKGLRITTVIVVDDVYAKLDNDYVYALCGKCNGIEPQALSELADLSEIDFGGDADYWGGALRELLASFTPAQTSALAKKLTAIMGDHVEDPEIRGASILAQVVVGVRLKELSYQDWLTNREYLLHPSRASRTLFLFDQDLSGDGGRTREGIAIIKSILLEFPKRRIICGLLSHTFIPGQEYAEWKELAASENIELDRFALISKARLSDDPIGFLQMLRLVLVNSKCKQLTRKAAELMNKANQEATVAINAIDIYDFEHLVFRSSRTEGVLESDTLFRLFSIFHRLEARKLAAVDEKFGKIAEHIRSVTDSIESNAFTPSPRTWKIRNMELYEDAEHVNSYHMPLEVGDIFKSQENRLFVLLAPPCDMMLRSDGERHKLVREVTVAEVLLGNTAEFADGSPIHPEQFFELPCFDSDTGKSRFVKFRSRHAVRLNVLDLCVYRTDGKAIHTIDDKCPESVMYLWKKHFETLSKQYATQFAEFEALLGLGATDTQASRIVPDAAIVPSLFDKRVNRQLRKIEFKCQRVRRLSEAYSAALLTRFSEYYSRDAFPHDYINVGEDRLLP